MGDFLGMGWIEVVVILIVAFLVAGPDKVPQYARQAGKYIRQFRKVTSGLTTEFNKALSLDEEDNPRPSVKKELAQIEADLQKDADELKRSLRQEADSLKKSVEASVRETQAALTTGGQTSACAEASPQPASLPAADAALPPVPVAGGAGESP
jgi:Tat protein translocase TatB subunit